MSLSPISRLPDDALIEIFQYHIPSNLIGVDSWNSTWMSIIHVCRRWRQILLDFGPIWTNIISTFPDLAEFMIKNSKELPLSLNLDMTALTHSSAWARRFVKPISSRIHSLRMSYTSSTAMGRMLDTFRDHHAPILTSLTICCHAIMDYERLLTPTDFLNLDFPSLTTLFLYDCSFVSSPTMPFARNITNLSIRCDKVKTIIPLLQHTPSLGKLAITIEEKPSSGAAHIPFVANPSSAQISLPSLGMLRFQGPPAQYVRLLGHISLPARTIMDLDLSPPLEVLDGLTNEYNDVLSFDGQAWKAVFSSLESQHTRHQDECGLPFRHVSLDITDDDHYQVMRFCAFTTDPNDTLPPDSLSATSFLGRSTIQPDFTLSWNTGDESRGDLSGFSCQLAHLIWEKLPLDFVTGISSTIVTDAPCYVRLWFNILLNTPLLESLFVDPESAASICIFLETASDFKKVASAIPQDYQKLPPFVRIMMTRSITAAAVRKAHTHLNSLHTLVIDGTDLYMETIDGALGFALQQRDDVGLPRLSLLSFKGCKVGVADLTELQGLVDRVVWGPECLAETDGEVPGEDSEDDEV